MHWRPGDSWTPLTAGTGVSNGGVWRTTDGFVVKRLLPGVERTDHYAYWRRQAEVASSGWFELSAGLRAPRCVKVDTDPDGITLWTEAVEPAEAGPAELADALGRFALNELEPADWFARAILRDRLANDEPRGGWAPLATAPELSVDLRALCDLLWARRSEVMAAFDELPHRVVHGDAHPLNLLRRDGDHVVAVDWEQFGIGPLGFDLGYLFLSTGHDLEELVTAYQEGSAARWPTALVRRGAVLTAAVTVVARAAWSLGQPDPGDHVERLVRLSSIVDEAVNHAS